MKRFIYLWTLSMLTIAILVACSLSSQEEPAANDASTAGAPTVRASNVSRRQAPPPGDDQVTALVQGNNQFATDLYHALANGDDNLIFSPYSISLAFSMAYAGARGDTAAQMQDVLHFLDQEHQHDAFNGLESHLSTLSLGHQQNDETGPAFELRVANAAWGQRGAPFADAYLETLAANYGAGLNTADFAQDPEAAREAINNWIAAATNDKIDSLLPPASLSPQTRLVLANAVYFYGAWLQPFNASETSDGPFTLRNGQTVSAPLMHERGMRVPYTAGDNFRAVQLPFTGRKADMLLILPAEGQFDAVQQALSPQFLAQIREEAGTFDVDITLPRFEFESDINLANTLPQLGLAHPFGGEANFTGILPDGGLSIDAALHKATIAVDEQGVEATASTVIEMEVSEMPRAEFEATRPFFMAIVERETGAILFLGHLANPLS